MWKICWNPKDPFVCPKISGFPVDFLLWGWDWEHQTYSREGYGFLGEKVRAIDGFIFFGFVCFFSKWLGKKKLDPVFMLKLNTGIFVWVQFGSFHSISDSWPYRTYDMLCKIPPREQDTSKVLRGRAFMVIIFFEGGEVEILLMGQKSCTSW